MERELVVEMSFFIYKIEEINRFIFIGCFEDEMSYICNYWNSV